MFDPQVNFRGSVTPLTPGSRGPAGRDTSITMNSVEIEITVVVLVDRTATCLLRLSRQQLSFLFSYFGGHFFRNFREKGLSTVCRLRQRPTKGRARVLWHGNRKMPL